MTPTLYEILVKARALYDEPYSEFICDCITAVEDEIHGQYVPEYPVSRKLLDFVKEDIEGAFSVKSYLYPNVGPYFLNPEQQTEVLQYREGLWQRLFDFAKEQEHE